MTITQTVEIPSDHRLVIDLPHKVPAGATARFELNVIQFDKKEDNSEKIRLTRQMIDEMLLNSPHTLALTGILNTNMTAEEIRDERLAKYSQ